MAQNPYPYGKPPDAWPQPGEKVTRKHCESLVDTAIEGGDLSLECQNYGVPYRGRKRDDVRQDLIDAVYKSHNPDEFPGDFPAQIDI